MCINIYRIILLVCICCVGIFWISCSGNSDGSGQTEVILSVNKNTLIADGKDVMTFVVMYTRIDVITDTIICSVMDGQTSDGSTFSTSRAGAYTFKTSYSNYASKLITIIMSVAPGTSSKSVRHICAMEFTGAWCAVYPVRMTRLNYLISSSYEDAVYLMSSHVDDTSADLMTVEQSSFLSRKFSVSSYPSCVVDMREATGLSKNYSVMRTVFNESLEEHPTSCEVAIQSRYNGQADVTVSVKSEKSAEYRLILYTVGNRLKYQQNDGRIYRDYTHNHVVRKLLSATVDGDKLGRITAGKERNISYTVIMEERRNVENLSFYALITDENGYVNNLAIRKAIDGGADYEYVNDWSHLPLLTMKESSISLLLMLGFIFVTGPMVFSCSGSEEPGVEPGVPMNPGAPLPPNPTPIRWVENEVGDGEYGVGIKVTSNIKHNFVFERTPGSKVQSYRLDVYPLCRMYNYLFKSVGMGVQATEEEAEDLMMEAIYSPEGAGAYTFNRKALGDSYSSTEFDWANSRYSQSRIVPGAGYLIITVGCDDEGGQNPADMKICHLETPVQNVISTPRMDIDVTTSYHAVGIQYLPSTDSKHLYQLCRDSEPIDTFINTYGKPVYIDFMRHWIQEAKDAQVPQEELYYTVDFGYTADAKKVITAASIGLDENKTPGEYIHQNSHLKKIDPDTELPECNLQISRIGVSMIDINVKMRDNCVAMFYRIFSASDWAPYENADGATMTTLARTLDQEGWDVKNTNFAQKGSYKGTEFQFDLLPGAPYITAYIGRNEYGQLSKGVKHVSFSTRVRITDTSDTSEADIDITITDPGHISLKLNYSYSQKTAVFYHQYIMTPDLLENTNKTELINYLLSADSNVRPVNATGGIGSFTWAGLDPTTEYIFTYMAEDWNGVLTDVKIVKATTEAIVAGPNPTMKLRAYMSEMNNFTIQFSTIKDMARTYHTVPENTYPASGDYIYQECTDVWKERCSGYGLTTVNSTTRSYDKTGEARRLVALCVPIGADSGGNEVIGDLYTVFYDKDKGVITDSSVSLLDAPKSIKGMIGTAKPQVIKKDRRIPADTITKEKVDKGIPGAMISGSTTYPDLKKLGKHPYAK